MSMQERGRETERGRERFGGWGWEVVSFSDKFFHSPLTLPPPHISYPLKKAAPENAVSRKLP
jgi:hypothetical protein